MWAEVAPVLSIAEKVWSNIDTTSFSNSWKNSMGTSSCPGAFPLGRALMAWVTSLRERSLVSLSFIACVTSAGHSSSRPSALPPCLELAHPRNIGWHKSSWHTRRGRFDLRLCPPWFPALIGRSFFFLCGGSQRRPWSKYPCILAIWKWKDVGFAPLSFGKSPRACLVHLKGCPALQRSLGPFEVGLQPVQSFWCLLWRKHHELPFRLWKARVARHYPVGG